MTKVLGLGHYSRTGKDSLANLTIAALRGIDPTLRVKKIPFAWKLKQICFELYAWDGLREPEFYDTKEGEPFRDIKLPTIGKTPVEIWVAMGTPAVRQQVYDKTWIDYLLKSALDADVLFIPDVRFPNETAAILEIGGTLTKVVRPGYGPRKTVADRALVGWNGWHYVFGGSGDMAELENRAEDLAAWLAGQGPQPIQSRRDREAALAVEVIEPWEPAVIAA